MFSVDLKRIREGRHVHVIKFFSERPFQVNAGLRDLNRIKFAKMRIPRGIASDRVSHQVQIGI